MVFADRQDAGRRLAWLLEGYRREQPIVLGLPRGGVVVAYEVASALGAPLDVLVVSKIGVPGVEEFAIGATASGITTVDVDMVRRLRVPLSVLDAIVRQETAEVHRREALYRGARLPVDVGGRTVIVVDDGLATAATAQAALHGLHALGPRRIVFAAPVCSPEGVAALREVADVVECLECPAEMWAEGFWYRDFTATTDADVVRCLRPIGILRVPA